MLLLAALIGVGAPAPAARAQDGSATVELTRISPEVVRPDSTIVVEGTVTNTGDRSLVRLQASLWRSLSPLTTREQLDAAGESEPTVPEGERMYSSETPDAYQDLYTEEQPELEPGESRRFRLQAEADAFFDPTAPQNAVYLAGVHIRENGILTVGRARTYLPTLATDKEVQTGQQSVGTASLIELTTRPSMTRTGTFVDDDLAEDVSAGGRLEALLSAAELSGSSYAVDPNLIAELRAMRSGYQVLDADGARTAGKGQQAAADWLTRFTRMQADHDGFRLPYANPDLAALAREERTDLLQAGERAAAQVAETKDLPLIVAPPDGAANQALLQAATDLGAEAVLLADSKTGGAAVVMKGDVGPTILSYRTQRQTAGPGPDPRDTAVQQRQASLADTYIDAISGQPEEALIRLRVIDEVDSAEGASESAPWLRERDLSSLLQQEPQPLTEQLNYPDQVAEAELTQRQIRRIGSLETDLRSYRNLAAQPRGLSDLSDQLLARASSAAWRDHGRAMNKYVDAQELLLTTTDGEPVSIADLADGDVVRVEGNPQVTLTGATGQVPVTIVNDLSIDVNLELMAESPNRSRLRLEDLSAKALGGPVKAGARVPAQVVAHADANGTLPVTLSLATPDGDPIGEPLPIRVNATQAGRIGWVIAIAAGVVLLTTVVLRIRQVARERGTEEETEPAADSEPDTTEDVDREGIDGV